MFKGCHFPNDVIIQTLRYNFAYKLSYRDIEEIQKERGVCIDHATINRWRNSLRAILCSRSIIVSRGKFCRV